MIFINILGLGLIAFIVWWFWIYKPTDAIELTEENKTIVVDSGIYQPTRIKVPSGQKTTLEFLRKDGSPCAATVIFPDFEISKELPLNNSLTIDLPPMEPGEYAFHCPMKMYSGILIVN